MLESKLAAIFAKVLEMPLDEVTDQTQYNTTKNWDSVAHMVIVAAIDDAFDIMLETTDIIAMNTFKKAKEIMQRYLVGAR